MYTARRIAAAAVMTLALSVASAPSLAQQQGAQGFQELFAHSLKEKRGLTFYMKGQNIAGIVTKVSSDTVEVRNQTHGRIVIRIDQIDAIAAAN